MPDDILIPTSSENNAPDNGLNTFDRVAWLLAGVLCRRCWRPWWTHGHGPFKALVDWPASHLFDAL